MLSSFQKLLTSTVNIGKKKKRKGNNDPVNVTAEKCMPAPVEIQYPFSSDVLGTALKDAWTEFVCLEERSLSKRLEIMDRIVRPLLLTQIISIHTQYVTHTYKQQRSFTHSQLPQAHSHLRHALTDAQGTRTPPESPVRARRAQKIRTHTQIETITGLPADFVIGLVNTIFCIIDADGVSVSSTPASTPAGAASDNPDFPQSRTPEPQSQQQQEEEEDVPLLALLANVVSQESNSSAHAAVLRTRSLLTSALGALCVTVFWPPNAVCVWDKTPDFAYVLMSFINTLLKRCAQLVYKASCVCEEASSENPGRTRKDDDSSSSSQHRAHNTYTPAQAMAVSQFLEAHKDVLTFMCVCSIFVSEFVSSSTLQFAPINTETQYLRQPKPFRSSSSTHTDNTSDDENNAHEDEADDDDVCVLPAQPWNPFVLHCMNFDFGELNIASYFTGETDASDTQPLAEQMADDFNYFKHTHPLASTHKQQSHSPHTHLVSPSNAQTTNRDLNGVQWAEAMSASGIFDVCVSMCDALETLLEMIVSVCELELQSRTEGQDIYSSTAYRLLHTIVCTQCELLCACASCVCEGSDITLDRVVPMTESLLQKFVCDSPTTRHFERFKHIYLLSRNSHSNAHSYNYPVSLFLHRRAALVVSINNSLLTFFTHTHISKSTTPHTFLSTHTLAQFYLWTDRYFNATRPQQPLSQAPADEARKEHADLSTEDNSSSVCARLHNFWTKTHIRIDQDTLEFSLHTQSDVDTDTDTDTQTRVPSSDHSASDSIAFVYSFVNEYKVSKCATDLWPWYAHTQTPTAPSSPSRVPKLAFAQGSASSSSSQKARDNDKHDSILMIPIDEDSRDMNYRLCCLLRHTHSQTQPQTRIYNNDRALEEITTHILRHTLTYQCFTFMFADILRNFVLHTHTQHMQANMCAQFAQLVNALSEYFESRENMSNFAHAHSQPSEAHAQFSFPEIQLHFIEFLFTCVNKWPFEFVYAYTRSHTLQLLLSRFFLCGGVEEIALLYDDTLFVDERSLPHSHAQSAHTQQSGGESKNSCRFWFMRDLMSMQEQPKTHSPLSRQSRSQSHVQSDAAITDTSDMDADKDDANVGLSLNEDCVNVSEQDLLVSPRSLDSGRSLASKTNTPPPLAQPTQIQSQDRTYERTWAWTCVFGWLRVRDRVLDLLHTIQTHALNCKRFHTHTCELTHISHTLRTLALTPSTHTLTLTYQCVRWCKYVLGSPLFVSLLQSPAHASTMQSVSLSHSQQQRPVNAVSDRVYVARMCVCAALDVCALHLQLVGLAKQTHVQVPQQTQSLSNSQQSNTHTHTRNAHLKFLWPARSTVCEFILFCSDVSVCVSEVDWIVLFLEKANNRHGHQSRTQDESDVPRPVLQQPAFSSSTRSLAHSRSLTSLATAEKQSQQQQEQAQAYNSMGDPQSLQQDFNSELNSDFHSHTHGHAADQPPLPTPPQQQKGAVQGEFTHTYTYTHAFNRTQITSSPRTRLKTLESLLLDPRSRAFALSMLAHVVCVYVSELAKSMTVCAHTNNSVAAALALNSSSANPNAQANKSTAGGGRARDDATDVLLQTLALTQHGQPHAAPLTLKANFNMDVFDRLLNIFSLCTHTHFAHTPTSNTHTHSATSHTFDSYTCGLQCVSVSAWLFRSAKTQSYRYELQTLFRMGDHIHTLMEALLALMHTHTYKQQQQQQQQQQQSRTTYGNSNAHKRSQNAQKQQMQQQQLENRLCLAIVRQCLTLLTCVMCGNDENRAVFAKLFIAHTHQQSQAHAQTSSRQQSPSQSPSLTPTNSASNLSTMSSTPASARRRRSSNASFTSASFSSTHTTTERTSSAADTHSQSQSQSQSLSQIITFEQMIQLMCGLEAGNISLETVCVLFEMLLETPCVCVFDGDATDRYKLTQLHTQGLFADLYDRPKIQNDTMLHFLFALLPHTHAHTQIFIVQSLVNLVCGRASLANKAVCVQTYPCVFDCVLELFASSARRVCGGTCCEVSDAHTESTTQASQEGDCAMDDHSQRQARGNGNKSWSMCTCGVNVLTAHASSSEGNTVEMRECGVCACVCEQYLLKLLVVLGKHSITVAQTKHLFQLMHTYEAATMPTTPTTAVVECPTSDEATPQALSRTGSNAHIVGPQTSLSPGSTHANTPNNSTRRQTFRHAHTQTILKALLGMLSEENKENEERTSPKSLRSLLSHAETQSQSANARALAHMQPRHTFVFEGNESGLRLPPVLSWPTKRGFTFCAWICVETPQARTHTHIHTCSDDSFIDLRTRTLSRAPGDTHAYVPTILNFRSHSGAGFELVLLPSPECVGEFRLCVISYQQPDTHTRKHQTQQLNPTLTLHPPAKYAHMQTQSPHGHARHAGAVSHVHTDHPNTPCVCETETLLSENKWHFIAFSISSSSGSSGAQQALQSHASTATATATTIAAAALLNTFGGGSKGGGAHAQAQHTQTTTLHPNVRQAEVCLVVDNTHTHAHMYYPNMGEMIQQPCVGTCPEFLNTHTQNEFLCAHIDMINTHENTHVGSTLTDTHTLNKTLRGQMGAFYFFRTHIHYQRLTQIYELGPMYVYGFEPFTSEYKEVKAVLQLQQQQQLHTTSTSRTEDTQAAATAAAIEEFIQTTPSTTSSNILDGQLSQQIFLCYNPAVCMPLDMPGTGPHTSSPKRSKRKHSSKSSGTHSTTSAALSRPTYAFADCTPVQNNVTWSASSAMLVDIVKASGVTTVDTHTHTYKMHAVALAGTTHTQTHDVRTCLDSLGGVKVLLPLFVQVDLPVQQQQQTHAQQLSPHLAYKESFTYLLLSVCKTYLQTHTHTNKHTNIPSLGLLGFFLQRISHTHLDIRTVELMISVYDTVLKTSSAVTSTHAQPGCNPPDSYALPHSLIEFVFMNFKHIWQKCAYEIQVRVLEFLLVCVCRNVSGHVFDFVHTHKILDALQQLYFLDHQRANADLPSQSEVETPPAHADTHGSAIVPNASVNSLTSIITTTESHVTHSPSRSSSQSSDHTQPQSRTHSNTQTQQQRQHQAGTQATSQTHIYSLTQAQCKHVRELLYRLLFVKLYQQSSSASSSNNNAHAMQLIREDILSLLDMAFPESKAHHETVTRGDDLRQLEMLQLLLHMLCVPGLGERVCVCLLTNIQQRQQQHDKEAVDADPSSPKTRTHTHAHTLPLVAIVQLCASPCECVRLFALLTVCRVCVMATNASSSSSSASSSLLTSDRHTGSDAAPSSHFRQTQSKFDAVTESSSPHKQSKRHQSSARTQSHAQTQSSQKESAGAIEIDTAALVNAVIQSHHSRAGAGKVVVNCSFAACDVSMQALADVLTHAVDNIVTAMRLATVGTTCDPDIQPANSSTQVDESVDASQYLRSILQAHSIATPTYDIRVQLETQVCVSALQLTIFAQLDPLCVCGLVCAIQSLGDQRYGTATIFDAHTHNGRGGGDASVTFINNNAPNSTSASETHQAAAGVADVFNESESALTHVHTHISSNVCVCIPLMLPHLLTYVRESFVSADTRCRVCVTLKTSVCVSDYNCNAILSVPEWHKYLIQLMDTECVRVSRWNAVKEYTQTFLLPTNAIQQQQPSLQSFIEKVEMHTQKATAVSDTCVRILTEILSKAIHIGAPNNDTHAYIPRVCARDSPSLTTNYSQVDCMKRMCICVCPTGSCNKCVCVNADRVIGVTVLRTILHTLMRLHKTQSPKTVRGAGAEDNSYNDSLNVQGVDTHKIALHLLIHTQQALTRFHKSLEVAISLSSHTQSQNQSQMQINNNEDDVAVQMLADKVLCMNVWLFAVCVHEYLCAYPVVAAALRASPTDADTHITALAQSYIQSYTPNATEEDGDNDNDEASENSHIADSHTDCTDSPRDALTSPRDALSPRSQGSDTAEIAPSASSALGAHTQAQTFTAAQCFEWNSNRNTLPIEDIKDKLDTVVSGLFDLSARYLQTHTQAAAHTFMHTQLPEFVIDDQYVDNIAHQPVTGIADALGGGAEAGTSTPHSTHTQQSQHAHLQTPPNTPQTYTHSHIRHAAIDQTPVHALASSKVHHATVQSATPTHTLTPPLPTLSQSQAHTHLYSPAGLCWLLIHVCACLMPLPTFILLDMPMQQTASSSLDEAEGSVDEILATNTHMNAAVMSSSPSRGAGVTMYTHKSPAKSRIKRADSNSSTSTTWSAETNAHAQLHRHNCLHAVFVLERLQQLLAYGNTLTQAYAVHAVGSQQTSLTDYVKQESLFVAISLLNRLQKCPAGVLVSAQQQAAYIGKLTTDNNAIIAEESRIVRTLLEFGLTLLYANKEAIIDTLTIPDMPVVRPSEDEAHAQTAKATAAQRTRSRAFTGFGSRLPKWFGRSARSKSTAAPIDASVDASQAVVGHDPLSYDADTSFHTPTNTPMKTATTSESESSTESNVSLQHTHSSYANQPPPLLPVAAAGFMSPAVSVRRQSINLSQAFAHQQHQQQVQRTQGSQNVSLNKTALIAQCMQLFEMVLATPSSAQHSTGDSPRLIEGIPQAPASMEVAIWEAVCMLLESAASPIYANTDMHTRDSISSVRSSLFADSTTQHQLSSTTSPIAVLSAYLQLSSVVFDKANTQMQYHLLNKLVEVHSHSRTQAAPVEIVSDNNNNNNSEENQNVTPTMEDMCLYALHLRATRRTEERHKQDDTISRRLHNRWQTIVGELTDERGPWGLFRSYREGGGSNMEPQEQVFWMLDMHESFMRQHPRLRRNLHGSRHSIASKIARGTRLSDVTRDSLVSTNSGLGGDTDTTSVSGDVNNADAGAPPSSSQSRRNSSSNNRALSLDNNLNLWKSMRKYNDGKHRRSHASPDNDSDNEEDNNSNSRTQNSNDRSLVPSSHTTTTATTASSAFALLQTQISDDTVLFSTSVEIITYASNSLAGRTRGTLEVTRARVTFTRDLNPQVQASGTVHASGFTGDNISTIGAINPEFVWVCAPFPNTTWSCVDITSMYQRHYLLQFTALELFFTSRTSVLINLFDETLAMNAYKCIAVRCRPPMLSILPHRHPERAVQSAIAKNNTTALLTQDWIHRRISNFEYLMHLNTLSGRSFNDCGQYPVFPWILANYISDTLDLKDGRSFRDLKWPMGAQTETQRKFVMQRFADATDMFSCNPEEEFPPFHHGTHYSCMGFVFWYLLRMEPFTSLHVWLQDGKFDHTDRLFNSIFSTWHGSTTNHNDVKELIPEFFYLPEFLENLSDCDLGTSQTGIKLNHVQLPPWSRGSAHEFVRMNREALESEWVSANLHHWIDLIFGYKQRPEMFGGSNAAVEACNVFFHVTYAEALNLEALKANDKVLYDRTIRQIDNYGQTPCRLFTNPHPSRLPLGKVRDLIWPIASVVWGADTLPNPATAQLSSEWFEKPELPKRVVCYRPEKVSAYPVLLIHELRGVKKLITVDSNRIIGLHSFTVKAADVVPPFLFKADGTALRVSQGLAPSSGWISSITTAGSTSNREYYVGVPFSAFDMFSMHASRKFYSSGIGMDAYLSPLIGTEFNKEQMMMQDRGSYQYGNAFTMPPGQQQQGVASQQINSPMLGIEEKMIPAVGSSDRKASRTNSGVFGVQFAAKRRISGTPGVASSDYYEVGGPLPASTSSYTPTKHGSFSSTATPSSSSSASKRGMNKHSSMRETISASTATSPTPLPLDTSNTQSRSRVDEHLSSQLFAAFPESRLIFSCGHWDQSVRVTTADTGKLIQSVLVHSEVVTCIALSSDYGQHWLVSGSKDCTAMVWEVVLERAAPLTVTPLHVLYGHDNTVTCVSVNAVMDIIATGSEDGTVILSSLREGNYLRTLAVNSVPSNWSSTYAGVNPITSVKAGKAVFNPSYASYKNMNMEATAGMGGAMLGAEQSNNAGAVTSGSSSQSLCVYMVELSSESNVVIYATDHNTQTHSLYSYTINGRLLERTYLSERLHCMILSEDGRVLITGGERCLLLFRWVHNLQLACDGPRSFQEAVLDGKEAEQPPFMSPIRSLYFTTKERHLIVGLESGELRILAQDSEYLRKRLVSNLEDIGLISSSTLSKNEFENMFI